MGRFFLFRSINVVSGLLLRCEWRSSACVHVLCCKSLTQPRIWIDALAFSKSLKASFEFFRPATYRKLGQCDIIIILSLMMA